VHQAYRKDDGRLVRRTTGLSDLCVHPGPLAVLCARWGLRTAGLYDGHSACLLHGLERWRSRHGGGRRPKGPPQPQPRGVELLEAGPRVVGGEPACGDAGRLRVLLWRECGVLSNRQSGCPFLHNVGFAFHQARCVSEPLDPVKRRVWREQQWPRSVRAAQRRRGWSLGAEAARFAPGGS
jgi:hypothetical protein